MSNVVQTHCVYHACRCFFDQTYKLLCPKPLYLSNAPMPSSIKHTCCFVLNHCIYQAYRCLLRSIIYLVLSKTTVFIKHTDAFSIKHICWPKPLYLSSVPMLSSIKHTCCFVQNHCVYQAHQCFLRSITH